MAAHRAFRKMRDRGVIEADRVFEIIDQRAEPGPEHDGAGVIARKIRPHERRARFGDGGVVVLAHRISSFRLAGPKASGSNSSGEEAVARIRHRIVQKDPGIGIGKFADALPATATGRRHGRAGADHGDGADPSAAAGHHRRDRRRFGADAFGISGILDIAAGMKRARLVDHGGADAEARIGRNARARARSRRRRTGHRLSSCDRIRSWPHYACDDPGNGSARYPCHDQFR